MKKQKYVSMFKIDGIPILPPLMTAARRREMATYKEQAVALETRLKLQATESQFTTAQELESISTVEDEYLKVSSMLQDPPPCTATATGSLKKLVTSIYDDSNAATIPPASAPLLCSKNTKPTQPSADLLKSPPSIKKTQPFAKVVTPSSARKLITTTPKSGCSALDLDNSVNVVENNTEKSPPTRKDFENVKSTQRASTSPALRQLPSPTPKLIRSGSFTLDSPSPALLNHLVRTVGNTSHDPFTENATTMSAPSSTTPTPQVRRKISNTKPNNSSFDSTKFYGATQQHSNAALFKNKKSPYEAKLCSKPKLLKKHKTPTIRITSATLKSKIAHSRSKLILSESPRRNVLNETNSPKNARTSSQQRSPTAKSAMLEHLAVRPATDRPAQTSTPTHVAVSAETNQPCRSPPVVTVPRKDFVDDKIKEIEEQHRTRIVELMQKQQQEQRHLQEQFEQQQKLLLEEFNMDLMSLKALQVSPVKHETNRDLDSPLEYQNDTNNNHNGFSSMDDQPTSLEDSQGYDMTSTLATSVESAKQTPRCNRRLFMESTKYSTQCVVECVPSPLRRRRTQAATVINAYVRGYLTRRLFQTDHVQNIIQTIRDTLLFAIRFHKETLHDKSEENIMFKSRLLQQLTSGCESLQSVFNLPTKERMQLIARDRFYQEKKVKAQNRALAKNSQNRRKPI